MITCGACGVARYCDVEHQQMVSILFQVIKCLFITTKREHSFIDYYNVKGTFVVYYNVKGTFIKCLFIT
jgi:hypothetical protein